jgi:hypothetical protein
MKRSPPILLLLVLLGAPQAARASDLYKGFLDENIPHHRAIKETLALIEARPNDAALYNDLGCLVARDGFWRDALRNFEKAAELDAKDSKPLFNAGIVEAWRGKWGPAKRALKKALKRGPGNWPAWWMLGYAEERLGNTEAAVDAYKKSLRVDTSLFDVRHNPFALTTQLKGRVLLETYGTRMIRAAMPKTEQLEDPERIATFLQRSRPPAPPTAGGAPVSESEPPAAGTGPVVTFVPGGAAPAHAPGAGSAPGAVPPYAVVPAPPRGATPAAPQTPAVGRRGRFRVAPSPTNVPAPDAPGPGVVPTPPVPVPGTE